MISSSNDLENLENMNKVLLENDSPNKLFNCKSPILLRFAFY